MSEGTYKSGRKKGFVVLYREAAQDARLSLEARGLFGLMVSLPDNWEYTVSGLAAKAGCGKDKIRRLLRELQDVGYLVREQSHDAGGKFAANVYVLQDEAPLSGNTDNGENRQREKPSTEKPSTEKPSTEKPSTEKPSTEKPSTEKPSTEKPSTEKPSPVFTTQNNKEEKNKDLKEPPKAPKGADGRKSRYALQDDARPLLRAYVGQDNELARALADFIQLREQLRAVNSAVAIKALLRKLDKLSGGDRRVKLQLIEEAMASSWKSVFPLKGGQAQAVATAREGGLDCGFR